MSTMVSLTIRTADRCDRCGAASKARTRNPDGSVLDWCRHHYVEHEDVLAPLLIAFVSDDQLETQPA